MNVLRVYAEFIHESDIWFSINSIRKYNSEARAYHIPEITTD